MKSNHFTLLTSALLLSTSPAFATAVVLKDDAKKTITLESELVFYGGDSVTFGPAAIEEIQRLWNEAAAKLKFGDSEYGVQIKIESRYITEQQACDEARTNASFRTNYVRVENSPAVARSFYLLKGNAGFFETSRDKIGTSTTSAHEYGHGLGLDHPATGVKMLGVPHIMWPRGTWVEAQYQYSPTAVSGQFGSTLNPAYRKVSPQEVETIGLDKLTFTQVLADMSQSQVGRTRPQNIIYDKKGIAFRCDVAFPRLVLTPTDQKPQGPVETTESSSLPHEVVE